MASSIARLHSIALINVMPMIPASESVREKPAGAKPTLRSMTDSHRSCAVRPNTSMCLSAISNVKITSSGRRSILSAADMRLQVSVHETPSTSDTLINVLSAILSMAPAADAPSRRAGSARTTASPVAPSAGIKVARSPRAGRTATSTNAIAAISIRYSGLCVRHTHRTQTNIPTRRTGAETEERARSIIDPSSCAPPPRRTRSSRLARCRTFCCITRCRAPAGS